MSTRWGIFSSSMSTEGLYVAPVHRLGTHRTRRYVRRALGVHGGLVLPCHGAPICKSKRDAERALVVFVLSGKAPQVERFP